MQRLKDLVEAVQTYLKNVKNKAAIIAIAGILGVFCAGPGVAAEQVVEAVRISTELGYTRVVFDLTKPADYKLMVLDGPDRLVIDFPPGSLGLDARTPNNANNSRSSVVQGIRSGLQPDATMRFVIDLQRPASPSIFTLAADQNHGHRLVVDFPDQSTADRQAGTTSKGLESKPATPVPATTPENATAIASPVPANSGQWSGNIGLQSRLFFQDPAFAGQNDHDISLSLEPQYYIDWADDSQRFAFRPFFRYDAVDDERTHFDVRELYWRMMADDFVIKAGVDVVFWGVTESQHLVDIINQTDLVENIDGEDKLGQPMLNIDYLSAVGTWQFYALPYFRERTFPGVDGRLRTNPPVDTDDPLWDSGDEEEHIDFALRWSHFIGDWDIGLAHFSGTSRTPVLVSAAGDPGSSLRPYYQQIDQTSLDVQATAGAWLYKLEAIYNSNKLEDYYATVGGFEFTYYGLRGGTSDLGWLLEYHYDERGQDSTSAFQNDLYTGLRLTGNDVAGTRLLAGVTVDLDDGSSFANLEAVRRLGEAWTITLEARSFFNVDDDNPAIFLSDDDYLEIQLDRYF